VGAVGHLHHQAGAAEAESRRPEQRGQRRAWPRGSPLLLPPLLLLLLLPRPLLSLLLLLLLLLLLPRPLPFLLLLLLLSLLLLRLSPFLLLLLLLRPQRACREAQQAVLPKSLGTQQGGWRAGVHGSCRAAGTAAVVCRGGVHTAPGGVWGRGRAVPHGSAGAELAGDHPTRPPSQRLAHTMACCGCRSQLSPEG